MYLMDNLNQTISYCSTTGTLQTGGIASVTTTTGGAATLSGTTGSSYCYGWNEYWQPYYYPTYIHTDKPVDTYKKAFNITKMLMKEYLKELKLADFMKMVDQIAKEL